MPANAQISRSGRFFISGTLRCKSTVAFFPMRSTDLKWISVGPHSVICKYLDQQSGFGHNQTIMIKLGCRI